MPQIYVLLWKYSTCFSLQRRVPLVQLGPEVSDEASIPVGGEEFMLLLIHTYRGRPLRQATEASDWGRRLRQATE
jgi:hypothetical protein